MGVVFELIYSMDARFEQVCDYISCQRYSDFHSFFFPPTYVDCLLQRHCQ